MSLENCPARTMLLALLASLAIGCDRSGATEVNLDCDMVLRRIKDGALEIQRRHGREPGGTVSKAASLLGRIKGYEAKLQNCDADSTERVNIMASLLAEIIGSPQRRKTMDERLRKLEVLAEKLPVEATPAADYDD